jgi:hypothetical protein
MAAQPQLIGIYLDIYDVPNLAQLKHAFCSKIRVSSFAAVFVA